MKSLFSSPAVGFEAPFDMLQACHERVERSLGLLQRLAEHLRLQGADHQAREAAHDVLRYFNLAAPAHHEDEERHVLPRLRALGQGELAERLAQDHVQMGAQWAAVRAQLERVQAGETLILQGVDELVALYHAHIEREEGSAFPAAAAGLDAAALAAMGGEMAARRRG